MSLFPKQSSSPVLGYQERYQSSTDVLVKQGDSQRAGGPLSFTPQRLCSRNLRERQGISDDQLELSKVRLIPDVSTAAYRAKLTKEVILWHCLKSIDINCNHGNSFLPLDVAIEQLEFRFHFSRATAYRQILHTKGTFLDIIDGNKGAIIEIWGRRRVINYLGIRQQLTDQHFRSVEDSQFQQHGMRKGQLFEAIHKPEVLKGATPQARDTIEARTGLSRVQQWRYDKLTGTRKTPNYAYQRDETTGKLIPVRQEIFSKCKGRRYMNKRNGQTYHTKQQPGGVGQLRDINRELRAANMDRKTGERQASSYPTPNTPAATLERSYFFRQRALIKALLRHTRINKEGYYLIPQRERHIRGRQEWCRIDTN